jgi:hypothetical protein
MTELRDIIDLLTETLSSQDATAHWMGSFNFDLGGRPIVLCENESGRVKVLAFAQRMRASRP